MFKSISWKVLTVFILLIVSVMIVVGTFLLNSISSYYHREFKTQMEELVFTGDFTSQLASAASSSDAVSEMSRLIEIYSGRIGLDSYRSCAILTGDTGNVLYSYDGTPEKETELTQNLLTALGGNVGNAVNRSARLMDYAYPVTADKGSAKYIVYVSDSKDELYAILGNIFTIIFWALFLGLAISVFLGFFMSKTIISPIVSLQRRAEKIASGDFEQRLDVRSRDEIGELTKTFNAMAAELDNTLSEIEVEKTKIETILRFMTDAVVAFYRDGSIMHINPAAEKMLGKDVTDKKTFAEFFEAMGVTDVDINTLLYLEQYKTVERDIEFDNKALKIHFAPFATEGGAADGVVTVIGDITKQQKLSLARREFVANVSHELRTPLTTVKSYAETLLDNAEDDSMEANFLRVIDSETDRMTRLVKDLLTLSMIEYDKMAFNKSNFSLYELTRTVTERLQMEAGRHNHILTFEGEKTMPGFFGDRDRIDQVITNMITNAIKYTHDGGVIKVGCHAKLTNAVITVTDNGIGIPKEDLPHIFDRFYRVDKARSRKSGGTGLGLAIAKEIVEAHSGTISIASEKGRGTKITVEMPLYSK